MIFDWEAVTLEALAEEIANRRGARTPCLVAVNGHSSSGKTSLADRLGSALAGADVLHTDDLAWHHGVFAWDELLVAEVLPVVRSGAALRYRPPAWVARHRPGEIALRADLDYLVVEGVGASQASVRSEVDVAIWVETREPTRLARDAVRVEAGEISAHGYANWMAEENAHLVAEQPWRQADLIVSGDDRSDDEDLIRLCRPPTRSTG